MRSEMNTRIADRLRYMAELRSQQGDGGFRVEAYRRAADTLAALEQPVDELLQAHGVAGLVALPNIGGGIGAAINEMVATGRWAQLDRLVGSLDPERLFMTIPGVGPRLARRLHEELNVETLEQLEMAAHDGRLEDMAGVGPRRAAGILAVLTDRLGRAWLRRAIAREPAVSVLLLIDAHYRKRAAAGLLKKIAPRRFNPTGAAWLPVMHEDRGKWLFTALFSNTARAHELGKTQDWVVIYFHTDAGPESQRTVVTETHGPLRGRRVVRGREAECANHYATAGESLASKSEPVSK